MTLPVREVESTRGPLESGLGPLMIAQPATTKATKVPRSKGRRVLFIVMEGRIQRSIGGKDGLCGRYALGVCSRRKPHKAGV